MAHPHEKLVLHLLGWRHCENGNNRLQHSSSFYSGKHTYQLSLNTTTYYYTRKFLQTTHKIWLRICKLYHTVHILNCLWITRRGNTRLRLNANKWRNKEKIAISGLFSWRTSWQQLWGIHLCWCVVVLCLFEYSCFMYSNTYALMNPCMQKMQLYI